MIADALVVTLTRGVSLADWDRLGLIEREWALYERLRADYGRILIVSCGDGRDVVLTRERCSGAEVVCDEGGLGRDGFEREAPLLVSEALGSVERIVVKTNQMEGGSLARAIAGRLRAEGKLAALVARGGYLFSRFVAEGEGAESGAARAASTEEGALCSAADLIVCTTDEMACDLAWRHGIERDRMRVVPNYVLVEEKGGAERDAMEVLYAGQLIERKRVDLIIEAVAMLDRSLGAHVSIVGEGPKRQELEAMAKARGVRASFAPRLPHGELLARLAGCGVYAHASRLEGHPKTIIEAMAAGCAVVAADAPGTREVVRHGETGLLVSGGAAEFASALDRVLRDRSIREALGERARAWAMANVSIDRIIDLERTAHRDAMAACERGARDSRAQPPGRGPQVRFEPSLLSATLEEQVGAFADAVGGFWKRLNPMAGARFVMALDDPLYRLQGHAAIAANGGLHPKHDLTGYHDFFCERIREGERVLDLGSGVGALAVAIATRTGARVTGMDFDAKNVASAQARARDACVDHLARFQLGDITTETAPGEHETIVLSNVLEHLADRPALLARWRETYGCDRFLIRVPMLERDWRVPWKRRLGVSWRLDDTHETEYMEDELRADLREAGLSPRAWITRWGEFWVEAGGAT